MLGPGDKLARVSLSKPSEVCDLEGVYSKRVTQGKPRQTPFLVLMGDFQVDTNPKGTVDCVSAHFI